MALFGRKRREAKSAPPAPPASSDETGAESVEQAAAAQDAAGAQPVLGDHTADALGPFDVADMTTTEGFIDLGSIMLPGIDGLVLSMEVEEASGAVVGVRIPIASSTLQLQAFAAPRSSGLWADIRQEIADGITSQGGAAREGEGPYGPELHTEVPGGPGGTTPMRFLGVDGPRWFLRAVLSGPAATDAEFAQPFIDLMRLVVVVRGDQPMAPRELLPLRVPEQPGTRASDPEGTPDAADLGPFERGPEITEIR